MYTCSNYKFKLHSSTSEAWQCNKKSSTKIFRYSVTLCCLAVQRTKYLLATVCASILLLLGFQFYEVAKHHLIWCMYGLYVVKSFLFRIKEVLNRGPRWGEWLYWTSQWCVNVNADPIAGTRRAILNRTVTCFFWILRTTTKDVSTAP